MSILSAWPELAATDPHFIYAGERKAKVQMPLGGIGCGGIGLTGNGRLIDWNIAGRARMGKYNGYSHFAIKARRADGSVADARVLNGPYDGDAAGALNHRRFSGHGIGATWGALAGLPHFEQAVFVGRFPGADIAFADPRFPGRVRLSAWSPFIPHEARDSGFPAACFTFEITNSSDEPLHYTLAGTLGGLDMATSLHASQRHASGTALSLSHIEGAQSLCIATDDGEAGVAHHHLRGQWFDALGTFWREFSSTAGVKDRRHDGPRANANMFGQPEHGTISVERLLQPGETTTVRMVIAWHFPSAEIYWHERHGPGSPDYAGEAPRWTNFYATQWPDAGAVARECLERWDGLHERTMAFRDLFFTSALPAPLLDAATSTLAVLRSPTVLRLDSGQVWAWEGTFENEGSCEGTCTHVWNYAQAMPTLFPELEATLRDSEWTYNQQADGGLTFRQRLPLGSGLDVIGPCVDGHYGALIKTYRDWRHTGDASVIHRHWPAIKKAAAYAWSPENPNRWDPEKTGLLHGKQHHTLDMELFGPNAWLSGFYITALRAAAEMAVEMEDPNFAAECEEIARRGGAKLLEELFDGEKFIQAIDLSDRSLLEPFRDHAAGVLGEDFMDGYWHGEAGQIKYQMGSGYFTDQLAGHWHAALAGLPPLAPEAQVQSAVDALFEHNFRRRLGDVVNPNRVYGFEDEAGLLICSFGADAPSIPIPYADEVWTGLEYEFAWLLLANGRREEAMDLLGAVRARYDGRRRNPYSDLECGNYYARSMSAFALVNLAAGIGFDAVTGELRLQAPTFGDGTYPFVLGTGWGSITWQGEAAEIRVQAGRLDISRIAGQGDLRCSLGPGDARKASVGANNPTSEPVTTP